MAEKVNDPATIADQNHWRVLMKEYSDLTPLIECYREYIKTEADIAEEKAMFGETHDEDFKQLIKDELKANQEKLEEYKEKLKILLLPKDPDADKNVIVEIRGGAGRGRSGIICGKPVSDVYDVCREQTLENRDHEHK
ncbi:hypothetical protein MML48_scaffold00007226 [Holotrichia oblita]|nr:hypothetical protein MML48_scaffold00007226 [Holotrichia oblita]